MKIYLAGPMRGKPFYNFEEFFRIEQVLITQGHEVVNPARMDVEWLKANMEVDDDWEWDKTPEEEFMKICEVFTLDECLKRDIEAITHCEAIVLMGDWKRSEGANKELNVSKMINIPAFEWINENMVELKDAGRKFDSMKPRYDLLDPDYVEGTVKVLTLGSIKYADNNWMKVDNFMNRYYAALLRHIQAIRRHEYLDKETGELHTSHASCCLMFMDWKIRRILKGIDKESIE